ncbi:MAG: 4Fe-4S dicluster domain-containing protein [Thermoleophilia bacterium]|nr:4Fe-4S dicluster domain-containing protein [Thermoleophilia bacterium]
MDLPTVCQQCERPMCLEVCPVDAPYRQEETGAMLIDYEKCLGCRMCMAGCPFGAIVWDDRDHKVKKCDLCDGDPKCVRYCEPKAVDYVRFSQAVLAKKRAIGERYSEFLKKFAE